MVQIFLLDVKEHDRSKADGQMWKEDSQWARILDEGWDLGRVKQVCTSDMAALLQSEHDRTCSIGQTCSNKDQIIVKPCNLLSVPLIKVWMSFPHPHRTRIFQT